MNDVGTTTGELVCEVRVNGFDVARLPRVLAAADRYAAAWQAHVRADVVHDAASRDYEDGIGGAAAGDAMRAAFDAAEDAVNAAYAELEAAAGALLRAARGDL